MLRSWLAVLLIGTWLRMQPAIIQIPIIKIAAIATISVIAAVTVTTVRFVIGPSPFGACLIRWLERGPRTTRVTQLRAKRYVCIPHGLVVMVCCNVVGVGRR